MSIQKAAIIYLVLVNLVSFCLFYTDKQKAIHQRWRISEKTLFLSAILGGSIGALLGMYLFRHKTRHLSFVIGIPLILAAQILILFFLFSTGALSGYQTLFLP